MEMSYESDLNVSKVGTFLGRYPVPVTSSCQGLLTMIEKFRDDTPFTVAILKRSVIDFTDEEENLMGEVLKNAELKQGVGNSELFSKALSHFEGAVKARMEQEIAFYSHRKDVQSRIYDIFVQSSFPYSRRQAECLHVFRRVVDQATGNPEEEPDKVIVMCIKGLLELMEEDDHLSDSTPSRVVLRSTVPFHINKLLERLMPLFKEECTRKIPSFVCPRITVDLACYVVERIDALLEVNKLLAPHEHFRLGMFEIYDKLMRIFKFSGLRLTDSQEDARLKVEEETNALEEISVMGSYEKIDQEWYNFMTELETAVMKREVIRGKDGDLEFAYYGPVNMAVRHVAWGLLHLMPVANNHLLSFPLFNLGMVNIVTNITERFLGLYPMR